MEDLAILGLDQTPVPDYVPADIWATIQVIEWMQDYCKKDKAIWEPLRVKAYAWASAKNSSEDLGLHLDRIDAFSNL